MSSDIINNQVMKGATVTAPQAGSLQASGLQKSATAERQNVAAATGTQLPPETSATAKVVEEKAQEVSAEKAQEVVEQLNNHAQTINRDLHFSVDDDSGRTVIRVINSETAELVRQIPSEEVLRLSETIRESIEGSTGVIVQTSA
ncbi:MAG: flagellar protein FlaG [Gammaproteobacteria bacterium]|nr:flagellar protein FlaG [Gammaproteobacteria bacterium]